MSGLYLSLVRPTPPTPTSPSALRRLIAWLRRLWRMGE